jgi:predicted RNA-binding Zn-ribbon protein involved in translation (DUF1610 family)
MIPLDQYEREMAQGKRGTGIACPECGTELVDDVPPIFTSGKRRLTCKICGFSKVVAG